METTTAKPKAKLCLRHSFYLILLKHIKLESSAGHLWNVFLFTFFIKRIKGIKIWSALEKNMIEQDNCVVFQAKTKNYG